MLTSKVSWQVCMIISASLQPTGTCRRALTGGLSAVPAEDLPAAMHNHAVKAHETNTSMHSKHQKDRPQEVHMLMLLSPVHSLQAHVHP